MFECDIGKRFEVILTEFGELIDGCRDIDLLEECEDSIDTPLGEITLGQ